MRARRSVTTVLTLGGAVVVWEASVRVFAIPRFLIPTPSAVWTALRARGGFFARHASVTLEETVAGFLVGLGVGIVLALLIAYSRRVADILLPLAVVGQIVPRVAMRGSP
jgi:NitT/TauT family transport system permease protein